MSAVRAFAVCLALAVAASALSACGFSPLYGEASAVRGLSRVALQTPDTRTGHLLREALSDKLARDASQAPLYRLNVAVEERRQPRGLRIDDTANRYELVLVGTYALTDAATGTVVHQRAETVRVTYDAADQPYAGVVARQDGQERAAGELAERIALDLARVLDQRAR